VLNNQIYGATQGGGIRFTNVNNPNIVDYNEWFQLGSGIYKNILTFNQQVYALNNANDLQRLNGNTLFHVFQFGTDVKGIKVNDGTLTASMSNHIQVFNAQFNMVTDFYTNQIDPHFNTG